MVGTREASGKGGQNVLLRMRVTAPPSPPRPDAPPPPPVAGALADPPFAALAFALRLLRCRRVGR